MNVFETNSVVFPIFISFNAKIVKQASLNAKSLFDIRYMFLCFLNRIIIFIKIDDITLPAYHVTKPTNADVSFVRTL